MWHINRKPMKNSTQICLSNIHLTPYLTISSWEWPEYRFFDNCYLWKYIHTEWDRKLIFNTDIGFDLYFHFLNQIGWGGGTLNPPGGSLSKILKKNVLSHVTYQSKAHEKLYSNMSTKCSLTTHSTISRWKWPENYLFIYDCFIEGSMSTPNEIESWISTRALVLTFDLYFHNFEPKLGREGHSGPPKGGNYLKYWENKCFGWNMSIKCSFDRQQLKMTRKFFYNCFIEGSMSTPNEIGSWVLVWTEQKLGRESTQVPSPQGG